MHAARDLHAVRAVIRREIGAETLAALHRPSAALDALGVALCWGLVAGLAVALATLPLGLPWLLCFALQGFALQGMGLLSHDAFIHRRIWGDRGSWIGAMICSFPVLLRPTWYAIAHRDHHRHLGTEADTETYKQTLDTGWKRALFLTVLGDRLAKLGRFGGAGTPMPEIRPAPGREAWRFHAERVGLGLFLLAVAGAALLWPAAVLQGYVLPLLVAAPVASTLRVILEHADVDPANGFHLATCYRTGLLTQVLFVADAGDCHLVHHLYSHIPWYRMRRAVRVMRPVLLAHGVTERRSLAQLLGGWFLRVYPHRSLWFPAPRT